MIPGLGTHQQKEDFTFQKASLERKDVSESYCKRFHLNIAVSLSVERPQGRRYKPGRSEEPQLLVIFGAVLSLSSKSFFEAVGTTISIKLSSTFSLYRALKYFIKKILSMRAELLQNIKLKIQNNLG